MPQPRTIRQHFSSTFLWTVLLPLTLTGVAVLAWSAWQLQHQARATLEAASREVAGTVDDHVGDYRRGMVLLAEILELEDPVRLGAGPSAWLDLFREIYADYVTMLIADPTGRVVSAAPWDSLAAAVGDGLNVADREYFRVARSGDGTFVSDVFRGRGFGDDPIVAISAGFSWPAAPGETGIVEGSLDLRDVTELIRPISTRPIEIQVIDRNHRIIASSLATEMPMEAVRREEGSAGRLRRLWSPDWFTARQTLPALGWEVIARQPVHSVYAPLLPFLSGLVLIVLSALVIAGLSFSRGSKRIGRWIRAAAEEVDLPHPEKIAVPVPDPHAPSEILSLAHALKRLIETIRTQQAKLHQHLAELELTVDARTSELREQRREFSEFLAEAPALIVSVDRDGRLLYSNNFWNEVMGCGAEDPDCPDITHFFDEAARGAWQDAVEKVERSGPSVPVRLSLMAHESPLEVSGRVIRQETTRGRVAFRGVFQDISELVQTQRKLRHSEQMLSLFIKNAPAGIAMFDSEMRYISASERWLSDYQLSGEEIIGKSYYELFPETPQRWRDIHRKCLQSGEAMRRGEDLLKRSDGTSDWLRWEIIPWQDVDGALGGLIMLSEIITEKKRLRDQLRVLADYDSLTGLLNRRAFLDRLRRLSRRRDPDQPPYGLLFIDLDRFKGINDEHGHYVGDRVLQEVGRRLKTGTRAEELAGRLAGDEFVVLLTETEDSQLATIIERYEALIAEPMKAAGYHLRISASIGGVLARPGEAADELLDRADRAMYRAKRNGSDAGDGAPD